MTSGSQMSCELPSPSHLQAQHTANTQFHYFLFLSNLLSFLFNPLFELLHQHVLVKALVEK